MNDRFVRFSCLVIDIVETLPATRVGNHVAGQLLRAGTAPLPNYAEAQAAESRRDFIHKLKVSLKELRETHSWLVVIQGKNLSTSAEYLTRGMTECSELIAILVTSIMTAQRNMTSEKYRSNMPV